MIHHLHLLLAIISLLSQGATCSNNQKQAKGCIPSCICEGKAHIRCAIDSQFIENAAKFNQFLRDNKPGEYAISVHFNTSETMIPEILRGLSMLRNVSLAGNNIKDVQSGIFDGMSIRHLSLSHNAITDASPKSFTRLDDLLTLDLSYNYLESVPKDLFAEMPRLEILNLEHNVLNIFPVVSNLPRLRILLVNDNRLSFTAPGQLSSLRSLQILKLQNNRFVSFDISPRTELLSLQSLDISGNPLRCSCGIAGLGQVLHSNTSLLERPLSTKCTTPDKQVVIVRDVVGKLDECTEPLTSVPFHSHVILITSHVELSCRVHGEPEPAIMWSTPWGHQFADVAHLHMLEDHCEECQPARRYRVQGLTGTSEVSVQNNGRILRISSFSSSFNGNISCTAFNRLGNATAIHYVKAYSAVKTVMLESLFIGACCAAVSLCLGFVVGAIKRAVLRWCSCVGRKKNVKHTPVDNVSVEENLNESHFEDRCKEDSMDFDDDYYPPETPFTTPVAISPTYSPKKSGTPGTPPGGAWLPSNILETMEEVRWRLRYGVGRRVESMKRNVHAIKESGSMYVHNIMESGSTAANKVKAGVVLGVETVKYHVQSIREFCGTGDMGVQTVSMISVETNVDTQESREVIKSFTIV